MKIGIIGCGTAGPAAAILLARDGHDVTIFERSTTLDPIGAGLLIQPTGMAVMRLLGLDQHLAELSVPIHRLHAVTHRARTVLDVQYPTHSHGHGVHRGALLETLLFGCRQAQIPIRIGIDICSIDHHLGVATDSSGHPHGPFDLVIVSDGARSKLRDASGLVRRVKPYPWGALWCVADDPTNTFGHTLAQVYRGAREVIGFLPSGRPSLDHANTISMFWSVRMRDIDRIRADGLDAWKAAVRRLTPRADPILQHITSMDQLITAGYHDVVLRTPFRGRTVFLGDSAHAMSPQLGQGANLALLDAAALWQALRTRSPLESQLAEYSHMRKRNIRFYQFVSRWLTPIFQSDWPLVGPVRDATFGPIGRLPPFRGFMLACLLGSKTGVFTSDRSLC